MLSNALTREIGIVLAIKLVLIGLIWFFFFRPVGGGALTSAEVGQALLHTNLVSHSKQP